MDIEIRKIVSRCAVISNGEIRIQGYMQAEFGHLRYYLARPEMELGLFPWNVKVSVNLQNRHAGLNIPKAPRTESPHCTSGQ